MEVLVMMMIPMNPNSMAMMMVMILPLREGISSIDFRLPESFLSLSLSMFSGPQRR
jgi:hypothetical protein